MKKDVVKTIAGASAVALVIGGFALTAALLSNNQMSENESKTQGSTQPPTKVENVTQPPTKVENVTQTQTEIQSDINSPEVVVVGKTSKGYEITMVNGITYIDGVMVVNKTYSLPADYMPYEQGGLDPTVKAAFNKLAAGAGAAGYNIWIASAMRTYDYQKNLYNRYVERDGQAAADRYSARPGHSEHQTGLCFDLNTIDKVHPDEDKWVAEHAHEYGFIVRYPEGKEDKTGYMSEPWHLRYVGVELATKVYNSGLCLEEYWGITSIYSN